MSRADATELEVRLTQILLLALLLAFRCLRCQLGEAAGMARPHECVLTGALGPQLSSLKLASLLSPKYPLYNSVCSSSKAPTKQQRPLRGRQADEERPPPPESFFGSAVAVLRHGPRQDPQACCLRPVQLHLHGLL